MPELKKSDLIMNLKKFLINERTSVSKLRGTADFYFVMNPVCIVVPQNKIISHIGGMKTFTLNQIHLTRLHRLHINTDNLV